MVSEVEDGFQSATDTRRKRSAYCLTWKVLFEDVELYGFEKQGFYSMRFYGNFRKTSDPDVSLPASSEEAIRHFPLNL